MRPERKKILKAVFIYVQHHDVWLEYVTKYSIGHKIKKPVKFESSLVWRSESFSIFAGSRGSFASEEEAFNLFEASIAKYGGQIIPLTKKVLKELELQYNYPTGRHYYLLPEARM